MTMTALDSLMAEPLSGIAFVQDYVELHFDGRILRALSPPTLEYDGKPYRFPEAGSRDALCRLIGERVERVDVDDESRIAVVFMNGATVAISLRQSDRTGPEAAHFVPGDNQPIEVW
jgi:hypothetical protein